MRGAERERRERPRDRGDREIEIEIEIEIDHRDRYIDRDREGGMDGGRQGGREGGERERERQIDTERAREIIVRKVNEGEIERKKESVKGGERTRASERGRQAKRLIVMKWG